MRDTANFLEYLRKWFTILNVRGKGMDKRMHDPLRKVIELDCDQSTENLQFISNFGDFMKSWLEGSYQPQVKFSKDTAMAMYYTSKGLVAAADHILRTFGSRGILASQK